MENNSNITIGTSGLTLELVDSIAHNPMVEVGLSDEAKSNIGRARKTVDDLINTDRVVYGINTGFGSLKDNIIDQQSLEKL